MNSIGVALIALACTFGGAVAGMALRGFLPEAHLHKQSRDVINLGIGLIGSMAAVVLGLLVDSAKTAFDAQNAGFQQMASNIVVLDRALEVYGPEAKEARGALRRTVASVLADVWPSSGSQSPGLEATGITSDADTLFHEIQNLSPRDDSHRWVQTQALQISVELARTRWLLSQQDGKSVPPPFLVVLVCWLSVLFISFGLFSPRNATVIAALLVCALCVSGALFLIVDLEQPFQGLIQISSDPFRNALSQLGQ